MSTPTRLGDLLPDVADDLADRFDPTDLIAGTSRLQGGSPTPVAAQQGSTDPSTVDLTAKADRIAALEHAQAKAKEWDQVAKDIRAEIEDAMGGPDGPAEVATVDGVPVVRWTRVKSNRLDQGALKREQPDTYALYLKASESRRFVLVDES